MLFLGAQQIKVYEPGDADWGVQARRRPRPGRGARGDHPRRLAVAVGRGVRQGGRQARARRALPRRAGHRQDDALQGDRDVLQLPVRDHPRLGLRVRPSSAWTRCSSASSPGARASRRPSGAASASSSSTRSTPSACAAQALGGGTPARRAEAREALDRRATDVDRGDGGVARAAVPRRARRSAAARTRTSTRSCRAPIEKMMIPPGMGGGGMALNSLLIVMDGIDDPPLTQALHHQPRQHVPRRACTSSRARSRGRRLRLPAAAAAQGRDLLHRGHQRPARGARPRARAPGPHGPPRLLPHADVGGPPRHLRPLPRQGRARARARHAREARRARAHHQRLLAGDDRPGLLDGAHLRARRRARRLRLAGPRRGDDDRRGRRRRRPALRQARGALDRDPRGRPRGLLAPLQREPALDAPVGAPARLLRRPPPGDADRGPLRVLALRGGRRADPHARRDGGRARLLRARTPRASAATCAR